MIKALIVDDSAWMRLMIIDALKPEGCVVTEARNGFEAISLCRNVPFDLITLDVTMPEMDGITALQEIRKINMSARIIMITSLGQECCKRAAFIHGANDVLIKPFNKEALINKVRAPLLEQKGEPIVYFK